MKEMPAINALADGSKYWEKEFDDFSIKVYIPQCDLPVEAVNYGFMAPYLLVFEENKMDQTSCINFAKQNGFEEIAKRFGSSVVFVYPNCDGGWDSAATDIFKKLIDETRISQYYENGIAKMRDRFTGEWGDIYIRGGLHRSYLYGYGKSADYIALNCLKTIEGNGLYGPGDITPAGCILNKLNVIPKPERKDIPVVSVDNSDEVNKILTDNLDYILIKDTLDTVKDFDSFVKRYRRMVGNINIEEDFDELGMVVEEGYCTVAISEDNNGDDKDLIEHNIGYVAYYNKGIMNDGPVPLVMCFHGGGDSAKCMVALADWHLVVNKYNFLLVSVENHTSSSATEAIEVIKYIQSKYNVDSERIYATGFSMGGCKSWDLYQEYPTYFAGVAPMDATFEIGYNVFGQKVLKPINEDILVPVFYVGGEDSPLPELPFQEKKCLDRLAYVLNVNKTNTRCKLSFDEQETWENSIMGLNGDEIVYDEDTNTGSTITMHKFYNEDGICYTIFASSSKQSHEMRHLNCENAWKFLSKFKRTKDGNIEVIE